MTALLRLASSGREYVRLSQAGPLARIVRRYDRVSDILDTGLPLWEGIDDQVLTERSDLGIEIHKVCYELAQSKDASELAANYPEMLRGYATSWLLFQRETGFVPWILEEPLCSEKLGVAGTPDSIGEDQLSPVVIDYTIGSPGKRKRLQTAAYEGLWKECHGDRRRFRRIEVHLKADGKYAFRPHDNPNDWYAFLGLLQFHRWKHS